MAASGCVVARRSRRWAIGIGCWLMAVAAVVFALRLALPSDGLRTLDPSGGATNGQLLLDSPHHSVNGIHGGDRLLAINGWPVTDILESPHQRPAHAGDVFTYTVEHDGSASDVRVVLRAHPDLLAWLGANLPGLVVNLGILLAAAWLVWRRPDEFAGHALLVFAAAWASSSLLPQAEPLDVWARPWLRFLSILGEGAYVASGLATLLFALAFPQPVGWLRRRPWIAVAAAPLVGAVWFAAAMTIGHNDASISDIANASAEAVWQLATIGAVLIAIARWFKLRRDAAARRRMQLVFLGLTVTFALIVIVKWLPIHPPTATFPFVVAIFPASVVIAIATRDLYDLDLALNRGLVAVSSTIVLLGLYLGAAALTVQLAGSSGPLTALPAAGVVAIALAPVRSRAQRFVGHRLFGIGGEPRLVFHRLGVRLAGSDDPDSLMAAVVDTATESLRLPYAAVQLRAGDAWQTVEERGRRPAAVETIDIAAGATVVGRLVVAPRRDAKALSPIDRQLLEDLARHSGVAARVAALLTQLRAAQQRLLVAREAERHRIHCDLHDGVGPTLVGLTLQLEVAADLAGDGPLGDLITRLHGAAARATTDVRRLVRALRPADLDELGLPAAIAAAAARLAAPNAPKFDLHGPSRLPELSAEVEDAAYKICLEAMSNAVRHSGATNCSVRLEQRGHDEKSRIGIEINDDGRGFGDDVPQGTGLSSMRERAEAVGGRLRIESMPGHGTHIDVDLPTTGRPPIELASIGWPGAVVLPREPTA